jgi:ankyrin repeat protein
VVDYANKYHETAMMLAVSRDDYNLLALLLNFGANVNRKREDGRTLLMAACMFNRNAQILKWLVSVGADVTAQDDKGQTALLHYFSTATSLRPDWESALDVLAGPSVDIDALGSFQDGFSVLHWIAWYGLTEACRRVLKLGADIDARNRKGETPLQVAMAGERREVALVLLDMGADVGEMHPRGIDTPMMRRLLSWASSNDRLHVGKLVVHKHKILQSQTGEGTLRRVSKVIRVDSP